MYVQSNLLYSLLSNVQSTVQLDLFRTSSGYVLNVLRRVLEVHEGPNIGLIGHSSLLSTVQCTLNLGTHPRSGPIHIVISIEMTYFMYSLLYIEPRYRQ